MKLMKQENIRSISFKCPSCSEHNYLNVILNFYSDGEVKTRFADDIETCVCSSCRIKLNVKSFARIKDIDIRIESEILK